MCYDLCKHFIGTYVRIYVHTYVYITITYVSKTQQTWYKIMHLRMYVFDVQ